MKTNECVYGKIVEIFKNMSSIYMTILASAINSGLFIMQLVVRSSFNEILKMRRLLF